MIPASCRLHPISVKSSTQKKHLISSRNNSNIWNYQLYKHGKSYHHFLKPAFTIDFLQDHYPHIDFELPIVVEFCSGTGEFLVELAKQYPKYLFIGVEAALPCIQRSLTKIEDTFHNLLFYHGYGFDFLAYDFLLIEIDMMMVNFPDPWPKKRHIKRRIISLDFIDQCAMRLKPSGDFFTATDSYPLFLHHQEIIDQCPRFQSINLTTRDVTDKTTLSKNVLLQCFQNSIDNIPIEFYSFTSRYQEKNLSHSQKVFYTHHRSTLLQN